MAENFTSDTVSEGDSGAGAARASALDPNIARQIRECCEQGYKLYDEGDFSRAIRQFYLAWTRLPKPQTQWQEAGWVLTALGDAYFCKGDYESGKQALLSALHCPEANGNPIIHLRLGQCHYELGELPEAADQFIRVQDQAGDNLLSGEDPKYRSLV